MEGVGDALHDAFMLVVGIVVSVLAVELIELLYG